MASKAIGRDTTANLGFEAKLWAAGVSSARQASRIGALSTDGRVSNSTTRRPAGMNLAFRCIDAQVVYGID